MGSCHTIAISRLGLGAADIGNLSLTDIDWTQSTNRSCWKVQARNQTTVASGCGRSHLALP